MRVPLRRCWSPWRCLGSCVGSWRWPSPGTPSSLLCVRPRYPHTTPWPYWTPPQQQLRVQGHSLKVRVTAKSEGHSQKWRSQQKGERNNHRWKIQPNVNVMAYRWGSQHKGENHSLKVRVTDNRWENQSKGEGRSQMVSEKQLNSEEKYQNILGWPQI